MGVLWKTMSCFIRNIRSDVLAMIQKWDNLQASIAAASDLLGKNERPLAGVHDVYHCETVHVQKRLTSYLRKQRFELLLSKMNSQNLVSDSKVFAD
jgi:hypothetical protein